MKELLLSAIRKGYKPVFYTPFGSNDWFPHPKKYDKQAEICETALIQAYLRDKGVDAEVIVVTTLQYAYNIYKDKLPEQKSAQLYFDYPTALISALKEGLKQIK